MVLRIGGTRVPERGGRPALRSVEGDGWTGGSCCTGPCCCAGGCCDASGARDTRGLKAPSRLLRRVRSSVWGGIARASREGFELPFSVPLAEKDDTGEGASL